MKIASLADVKSRFSGYIDECESKGPVVITRNVKSVAVLLAPADDDDLERILLSRSARIQSLLNRSRRSIRAGRGISQREFWMASRSKSARSSL